MLAVAAIVAMSPGLLDYSIAQWRKDPEVRMQDAYKWLYHATHGGDHAIPMDGGDGPRRWMEREWAGLDLTLRGEPEAVKLDPAGRVLRVNLRPFRARGGNRDMLLAVFVASARAVRPDPKAFSREWRALGSRLRRQGIGRLRSADWLKLDDAMRREGYPAVHHSPEYERARRPAYRVVAGDLWM